MYEDALNKINQKLALREAIERANEGISKRNELSSLGGGDEASSRCETISNRSKLSKSQFSYSKRSHVPS